ncbi:MAG: precorrin-3B C(17)-methyltransferase, partial [Caldimicrobium sp.]
KIFGIESVSEASALCASCGTLLIPKQVYRDLTISLAIEPFKGQGRLYVVGIGPGDKEHLTIKALRTLISVEAVVGYKTYLKQISSLLVGKDVYSFSMTEELERVKRAVALALEGKNTALISGGDPGIYGMSGLLLEYIMKHNLSLEVEIIPGLSALNIGNALLGAPLANDFAVISLSDRLTPWETIEKRLRLLAQSDLPLVIYNPRSKGRKQQFLNALAIIRNFREENTYVGIINSATREDEEVIITILKDLPEEKVGMNSLLIVGSEGVKKLGSYLISQRGYEKKYGEEL